MGNWYYYDLSGYRQGPVDSDTLKRLALMGEVTPSTKVETENGRQSVAGKIHGLDFGTSSFGSAPVPPAPAPVPKPSPPPPSPPMPTPVTSIQYEYKCVAAPMILNVSSSSPTMKSADEAKAAASYGDIINKECYGNWEFYSMEQITVQNQPGCFGFLAGMSVTNTVYNMLVFRRQK